MLFRLKKIIKKNDVDKCFWNADRFRFKAFVSKPSALTDFTHFDTLLDYHLPTPLLEVAPVILPPKATNPRGPRQSNKRKR
jgi:hypothetical protein